ncbi:MAG: ImmA/IrrE family metallo-endopeptidase [Mesorhizobium sp.]|uniref:ImmA/IrrE family metallo-endopeptidase n=1 Tax=unclassified Mesorhizobium TaxID=325217 RepID=UPI000FE8CF86|nr:MULTISPECIES: ImmA/IrrE family metallo-endopeptidase [unclassified Mesorhizobium]RWB29147.1 MAG: ImmA/IrrE family metallo-endopeptidase [Mesorhizobium sp.]RWB50864.1 MAG: ImmA/IrrE family metallo-endopeptidase [Mesorhizobium sp.]RWC32036.1 MAG: ImmA/IrrE family metallo-endopeptidase [Mesorhizobium sp.]TGU01049.1 ImmA/IrrE family metallo-endopeptidase [Mesorhizobium sp. M5C.F.Ca.ET.164.01.1.1]TKD48143.1 MAG: ImmA/IrrE family metallo-endopeptidase [Mesorhizobium sp.]
MTTPGEIVLNFTGEAPVNIEGMVEALGVELERKAELHPEIAGQIELLDDGRFKISINKNDHYFRRRFTTAHELAHFLLHRNLIGRGLDDTKAYRSLNIGNFYNQSVTSQHEVEANRLASRLLMPKPLVQRYHAAMGGDRKDLAKKFQVSPEAMGYRLQALGLA